MRSKTFVYAVTALVGSRLSNIFEKCRPYRVSPAYYGRYVFTLIVAGLLEVLNLWERIIWGKKMRETSTGKPPVFIVGFWRSGTTLLHNLLCGDPDAACTTTFQNVFPNITLSQNWWLKPVTNFFLPEHRPFDNVHMDMGNPQEEEFALVNLRPKSLYNFLIFPEDFERIVATELFPESFTDEELDKWKECYRGLIAKAMLNTGGTRFVSKNPINMVRMKVLKEMYPDAKFIFIYRNPYQAVESFYRFVLSIFPGIRLQKVPASFTREKIVKFYVEMMNRYFADRHGIPPGDLIEIRMEDFLNDKMRFMEEIYRKFDLGPSEKMQEYVAQYLRVHGHDNNHHYEIPGETYSLVNEYASDVMSRLGYERTTVPF